MRGLSQVCLLLLGILSTALVSAQQTDARAMLKAMSDYVGSQQSLQLSFDSSIEVITPQLEKIQFTNSGSVLLRRPDKLRAHRLGGYSDVAMVFNGKMVKMYGAHTKAYAELEAPGSVDHLIHALRAGHGVALPGADLLLSNSAEVLLADVQEARYIGRGVIDGVECEHLAFRNFDTDWQLWLETGDRPAPRKLVITSKTINSAPQYTVLIKEWKAGVATKGADFEFSPPAGARQIDANALIEFDELPEGAER